MMWIKHPVPQPTIPFWFPNQKGTILAGNQNGRVVLWDWRPNHAI